MSPNQDTQTDQRKKYGQESKRWNSKIPKQGVSCEYINVKHNTKYKIMCKIWYAISSSMRGLRPAYQRDEHKVNILLYILNILLDLLRKMIAYRWDQIKYFDRRFSKIKHSGLMRLHNSYKCYFSM